MRIADERAAPGDRVEPVRPVSPVAVEYALTVPGRTVLPPFRALHAWTKDNLEGVKAARRAFDARLLADDPIVTDV